MIQWSNLYQRKWSTLLPLSKYGIWQSIFSWLFYLIFFIYFRDSSGLDNKKWICISYSKCLSQSMILLKLFSLRKCWQSGNYDLLPLCQSQVECSRAPILNIPWGSFQQDGILWYHQYLLQVEIYPAVWSTYYGTYFHCGSIDRAGITTFSHCGQGHAGRSNVSYLLPTKGTIVEVFNRVYYRVLRYQVPLQMEKYPAVWSMLLPTYFHCGSNRHRSRPTCLDRQQHSKQGQRSEYNWNYGKN